MTENDVLINHERIHLRQQLELLWVFFFIWYVTEFIFHLLIKRNWKLAYHSICFEKEAYQNEENPDYLRTRKNWTFLKYLTKTD